MSTAERIKHLRLSKNLKQSELAEKSGISRVAIGNYERGDRTPNIEILLKIAKALDVYVTDLLELNEALTNTSAIQRLLEKYNYKVHQFDENGYEKIKILNDHDTVTIMLKSEFINLGFQLVSSIENFEKLQLKDFLEFYNNPK